jgi:regulator of nucleoside diphosphate kinase
MALVPREAFFLASEMNRASVVPDNSDFRGVVHMGSQARYCDHRTGDVRDVAMGSHPIRSGKKSPSPSAIQ